MWLLFFSRSFNIFCYFLSCLWVLILIMINFTWSLLNKELLYNPLRRMILFCNNWDLIIYISVWFLFLVCCPVRIMYFINGFDLGSKSRNRLIIRHSCLDLLLFFWYYMGRECIYKSWKNRLFFFGFLYLL